MTKNVIKMQILIVSTFYISYKFKRRDEVLFQLHAQYFCRVDRYRPKWKSPNEFEYRFPIWNVIKIRWFWR